MTQRDLFSLNVQLRCIDPAQNKRRFYRMSVHRNLFGEWVLIREWGRIGRAGRLKSECFTSSATAATALDALARSKARRGYVIINNEGDIL